MPANITEITLLQKLRNQQLRTSPTVKVIDPICVYVRWTKNAKLPASTAWSSTLSVQV